MRNVEDDPKLYEESLKAYYRACEKEGGVPDQPGNTSEIGKKYVYLRNAYRLLARYDIESKKIIWPNQKG